jgi:DNA-binding response OmpR family regulator
MKILIVEDERRLAQLLKKGLEENAFVVDLASDGEEGLYLAETYPYDAVLLDIMLPEMDGLAILQSLRTRAIEVPVLLVTARGDVDDRIKGLNLGADDYIAKPFDLEELIARLRSVIRRSKGRPSPLIEIADLAIDTNARTVARGGTAIVLTAREYTLLEYLALNAGRVIGRTELIEHIYGTEFEWESNVIDVHISYLRTKIDKGFGTPLIHTVRGAGYLLKGEP